MFSTIQSSAPSTRQSGLPSLLLLAIAAGCSGEGGGTMIADADQYLDALPDYPVSGSSL